MSDGITVGKLARVILSIPRITGGGYGGQMITDWACMLCGEHHTHGNTAAPLVCAACVKDLREAARDV